MPSELWFDNMTTFETLVLFLLTVISVLIALSIYLNMETLDEVSKEIIKQEKEPRASPEDSTWYGLYSVFFWWGISVFIAGIIFLIIFLIDLAV